MLSENARLVLMDLNRRTVWNTIGTARQTESSNSKSDGCMTGLSMPTDFLLFRHEINEERLNAPSDCQISDCKNLRRRLSDRCLLRCIFPSCHPCSLANDASHGQRTGQRDVAGNWIICACLATIRLFVELA